MKYKIMSFNIKCDEIFANLEKEQLWDNRKQNLVKEILDEMPDLIGMQEVMPHQQDYLLSKLSKNYSCVYNSRDDNAPNGEGSPIYYNKTKFELIESKTFWLSETPDIPASMSWNTRWPRICTYAILKDKLTEKNFAHFNTHLDHKSDDARVNGIKLILKTIKQINLPSLLTGDFNSSPKENASLVCDSELTNVNTKDETITFHLWGHPECLKPNLLNIDYIFVRDFKFSNYKVLNNVENAVINSDHYAIVSDVELL